MLRYNWIALVFLCSLGPAWADNEELGTRDLVQPDGTRFSVREYVDEFGHYLLADAGYVIQDATTGYYYYARYDNTGEATLSTLRVGRDDASSAVAQLALENRRALMKMARLSRGFESLVRAAGTAGAMTLPTSLSVILVEFSDVKHQNPNDWPVEGFTGTKDDGDEDTEDYPEYTVSNFENMLFGDNYTGRSPDNDVVYGSMRQYYEDMSRQRGTDTTPYAINGRVVNQVLEDDSDIPVWVTLGNTKSSFDSIEGRTKEQARKIFRNAVLAAAESQQGIDTTTTATRKICIIYAGNRYGAAALNPHHYKSIYVMSEKVSLPTGVDHNSDKFSHIGVHCHEFGHLLGLADYYGDTTYHLWGLMANGSRKGLGAYPSPLSPHLRSLLGWLTPTEVTDFKETELLSYSSFQDDVYLIRSSSDRTDFFLIENRQPDEKWNRGLYGGLLIWHIKDQPVEEDDWIDLIEADDVSGTTGSAGDPFPGSTENRSLTDFTTPSSREFPPERELSLELEPPLEPIEPTIGDNSNVLVTNISDSRMEMTADLSPFWVGTIAENTTWSGTVRVGGDVTVSPSFTLTIEENSTIQFLADTDAAAGGTDTGRSELIVQGTLTASAGGIIFGSASGTPSSGDWYGIRVRSGGTAHLQGATIRDGLRCTHNEGGTLNVDSNTTAFSNCGLTIRGESSISLDEDVSDPPASRTTVATYTVEETEGAALSSVTWSLAEVGTAPLEINTNGELIFNEALDFERLTEVGAVNDHIAYQIKVQAAVGPKALEQEVTVTVRNVDEAGVVTVKPTTPRADGTTSPPRQGEELTAMLTDPDRGITGTRWTWERQTDSNDWMQVATSSGSVSSTYIPQAEDVGQLLQARVSYQDGEGTAEKNAEAQTESVVGVPGEPELLEPVVVDGQVTLMWQAPSSTGGLQILRYEYQQSDDGGQMWPAEGEDTDVDCQAATCSQELALEPGLYAFGIRAVNAVGSSDWVRTGPIRISSLVIESEGSNDPELAFTEVVSGETRSLVVETYTASGVADGTTVGWSLVGADRGAFTIDGGVLRFATAPDYEMPTDAGHATDEDGNNVYHVTVQAMAGEQMATLAVAVEVTNADDPGVVTLSSTQPEVDEPIRATLTDQDGSVENVRWSWSYFSSEDSRRNGDATVVASTAEFTPSGVLMGLRLQARALYADRLGTHQSAESVQTEPVVGRPSAPQNLTATPSEGSLVLAWDAPSLAGYPAFSGYRYRYKAKGTAWQPSATGALVDQTTRPTLEEGLIHGKEHTVEVWAVNAQGAGPAATTTATPPSPDTPGRVELTSRRPRVGVPLTATLVDPDAPVRVRRWRWLQSPWYYRSESDSSLVAPSAVRYPALASYEPTVSALGRRLRAVVDYTDQYGTQSAQSAWTTPVQPGWPGSPELSYVAGDEQVALTWTAAADHGAAIIRYQYHRSDKSGKWLDVPGDGLDGRYTVGGLTNDADYTFKVRAVNAVGEGSPSNAVTATPQGPADPNPNAPEIAGPEHVSVAEGATGRLADYTTSDDDGDRVTLTLSATGDGLFSLNSSGENSSGELRITRALDYESDETRYTVTLTATDDGTPPKSETKDVEVEVTNVDEAGRVSLTASSPRVGDRLTASLSDPDGYQSGGSWQWLQFHGGRDGDDESWVEDPSVRYTADSYTVQASDVGRRLIARISDYTDGHGSGKTAQSVLTATVQEAAESNPNAPVIAGPGSVSIDEGTTGILDTYTTSDADGDDVTLTLSDADEGPFSLNSSGELRVTSALDYESDETRYTVTLTATDNGTPPKSSTKDVTVEVDNVEEEGSVSLSDTSPTVGDHITATLTDPDGGLLYSTTTWSWNDVSRSEESSDDQARATSVTSYRYTVQASDEGRRIRVSASYTDGHGSGKSASTTSGVVQPRPNQAPSTPSGPSPVSVAENTTSVASYTSSDPNGDGLTWSVDNSAFSISGGSLRFRSAPNYESDARRYSVGIWTSDGSLSSGTKTVEVNVTNVEEEGSVSLSDTSPTVGDHITATLTDPDGGLLYSTTTWSWNDVSRSEESSDDQARATSVTSYRYTVQASDEGRRIRVSASYTDGHGSGKSASTTSGVVQPRPNQAPSTPSGPSPVSVAENTTSVASYTSSDPNGDGLTWSVDNSAFSISGGSLRFRSAPNYESDARRYTVGIWTSDGSLSSGTKTVEVTNVDEAGTVTLSDTSPQVGDHLTATLSDPDGGIRNVSWYWQALIRSDDSDADQPRTTSYPYTVQASDEGKRIQVRATYTDAQGSSKSARTTSGEVQARPNQAPSTPSGPSPVSVAENTTSVASYTSSDPNGDGLTWSVDNSAFSISGGSLRFRSAPNYESDARRYTVGIWTSDGSLSSGTKTVEVEVTNVEEAGTVSLTSSSPRVGDRLTASLSDPDGYQSGGSWSWQTFRRETKDSEDSWAEDESRESDESWVDDPSERYAASSYTVRSTDVGRRLRARISNYTDGHGSGKSANSSLTSTVQAAVPGAPPNFTAEPGNIYTRVDLSWSAAQANGSAITDYEYRAQPPGGSWSGWTSVGVAYSTTVSGLSSGQRYSFEVRAVNGAGDGPSSSTSSLVRTPPAKPISLQALPDILSAVAAPNPFNPTTTLHLQVPMRSSVWLTIYNIAGQVVRTLLDDYELEAGYHTIDWDGRDQLGQPVTSGVYLYQLRAGPQAIVHKLLLLQ